MVNSADIRNYLQRLLNKYQQWWKLYRLLDEEHEPFDFRVEVQTEEPIQEDNPTRRNSQKKIIPFPVLDGIDCYVTKEPVLLVGQPGSGKSTALVRFLLKAVEQARLDPQAPIPVLIELRRYKTQSGVLTLIQNSLKRFGLKGADMEELRIAERPFLLLLDGLNELPSKQALTDLRNFREDCSDLGIPMVVTTRELGGDNLGIKRQLEIKSLTPPEIQRFLQTCLPQESKQRLQELSDRLRELGRTPLMLWMLYVVLFKEPQEKIPDSRGELFRRFIQIYERQREEKIYLDEDSRLDGETRRWWTRLLKPLAFEMMRSGKLGEPTDFRLEISKQDAETICKDFLKAQEVNNYSDLAIRCLDALIKHHLIQFNSESQEIEFCHQLLQEYYAAEWLLQRLDNLTDEQLKYYFLNYLKWTEALGLMLGLIDENSFEGNGRKEVLRVVRLSLEIDLMLGARLAGEVKEIFQEKTIELISTYQFENGQQVQDWLKLELFAESRSDAAVPKIKKILDTDEEIVDIAAEMLGRIGTPAATQALLQALQHKYGNARYGAAKALGKVGSDEAIWGLRTALHDKDFSVVCIAVDSMNEVGSPKIVPILVEALQHSSENVTKRAISSLEKFDSPEVTEIIKNALHHEHDVVRWKASQILSERCGEEILPYIVELSKDPDWQIREQALEIIEKLETRKLEKIDQRESPKQNLYKPIDVLIRDFQSEIFDVYWKADHQLKKAPREQVISQVLLLLEHENPTIRRNSADLLGEIGSQREVAVLIFRLNRENDAEVRREIAVALGKLGSTAAVHELIEALKHQNRFQRLEVAKILGLLQVDETIPCLIQALNDEAEEVRSTVAKILGDIRIEKAVPRLAQALKDEDQGVRVYAVEALIKIGSESAFLHLIDAWRNRDVFSYDIACLLKSIENKSSAIALPHLVKMIPNETQSSVLRAIHNIQSCCEFYNYDIATQSSPPPSINLETLSTDCSPTYIFNAPVGNVAHIVHKNQITNQQIELNEQE